MSDRTLSLKEKILIAAVEGTGGNTGTAFTIEELAVWAWERDKSAWGLRGYEAKHPDLDKVRKDMGARGAEQKGVVQLGWVERIEPRVYRLTPAGLAEFAALGNSSDYATNGELQEKASRALESEITRILEHPVFQQWLKDHRRPKYFREAGHFWGIAPGTPPAVVRERVGGVDNTLNASLKLLNERGTEEIVSRRGKVLFDRRDIERCVQFQHALKERFTRDLLLLDPSMELCATGQT
jgi:hypothetical protein